MRQLDVERAQAFKVDDREKILSAVRRYPGGASEVNKRIKDEMRAWLADSAKSALDGLSTEMRGTSKLLMDVADLFHHQGKYDQAEALYCEALKGRRRKLGDEHRNTLASMNSLAMLLKDQRRYDQAETLYRVMLVIQRRVSGNAHPNTLISMSNLTMLLKERRKAIHAPKWFKSRADDLFKRSFRIDVLVSEFSGGTHPETLSLIDDLSTVLPNDQLESDIDESGYREAVEISRRELGNAHRDTLTCIYGLAVLLHGNRKYDQAEPLYREVIEGRARELGDEHPDTLKPKVDLATLFFERNQYSEAEVLYRVVLGCRQRVLGHGHPDTLSLTGELAGLLGHMGKFLPFEAQFPCYDCRLAWNPYLVKAKELYLESLEGIRRELGDAHHKYAIACCNMGYFLANTQMILTGQSLFYPRCWMEAVEYFDLAATAYGRCYGENHVEARYAQSEANELRMQIRSRFLVAFLTWSLIIGLSIYGLTVWV